MMLPKYLVNLAVIIFILSSPLYAQIDTDTTNHGININFINGYAVSYKWNRTQSLNYRIYLDINSRWFNDKQETYHFKYDGSPYNNISTIDRKNIGLDLSFQFLFNIIPQQSYTLYLGAGPNLTFGASYAEFTSKDEDQAEIRISSSTSTSYGIGIIALIGTEANLTNNISLFAESHFTLSKSWSSSDNTSNSYLSSSSKNTVWSANIHIVKVGLGIYF